MGCPLVVHYWADLQPVHGFRCYDNTHVCKLIALNTVNAYSAERVMSVSACSNKQIILILNRTLTEALYRVTRCHRFSRVYDNATNIDSICWWHYRRPIQSTRIVVYAKSTLKARLKVHFTVAVYTVFFSVIAYLLTTLGLAAV